MENFILEDIKKYINNVLDTYSISSTHVIQSVVTINPYKIIQISPSSFLYNIINENQDFKSYIIQIINSVLIDYDVSVNYLGIQFNDSVILIIFSFTHIITEDVSYLSLLPEEILQETLLNLEYDNIKRLCATSTNYIKICKSDEFWRAKFIHDHGFNPPITGLDKSLENIYLNQNTVLSFGTNWTGELGLGDNTERNTPTKIPSIKRRVAYAATFNIIAKSVSSGLYNTVIIDMNNEVWSFGDNDMGQLGLGDNINRNTPTKIPSFLAKSVSCGSNHTVIIDMNNEVWSFGDNYNGQLGLGDNTERNTPTKIPGILAKSVSCGVLHTVIIDMNNEVWSFGYNEYGELGLGDNIHRNTLTKIPNIIANSVSCGYFYTVIIDMNNEVWSFGSNNKGQLGLGDNTDRNTPTKIPSILAKFVSCGGDHTVIIDMNNEVWSLGNNRYGELGLGDNRKRNTPTKIPNIIAKSVSCGRSHTVIIIGI